MEHQHPSRTETVSGRIVRRATPLAETSLELSNDFKDDGDRFEDDDGSSTWKSCEPSMRCPSKSERKASEREKVILHDFVAGDSLPFCRIEPQPGSWRLHSLLTAQLRQSVNLT